MSISGSRFSEYTETNHQAPLWIATFLSLVYSVGFLLIRLLLKIGFRGPDDVALWLAYLIALAQWIVMLIALKDGVAKAVSIVDASSLLAASRLIFASRVLTILAIGLSKCSVILFLRQLFTRDFEKPWLLSTIMTVVLSCWTVASTIICGANCAPYPSTRSKVLWKCGGDDARWTSIAVVDAVFEITLVALPAYLFAPFRMPLSRKVTVAAAFSFRLGVSALFIIYLISYLDFLDHGQPNIGLTNTLAFQQGLLAYSLISATIPCLKSFLGRFQTGGLRLSGSETAECVINIDSHVHGFAMRSFDDRYQLELSPSASHFSCDEIGNLPVICDNGTGEDKVSMKRSRNERMTIHHKVESNAASEL